MRLYYEDSMRYYVGVTKNYRTTFRAAETPTEKTHGHLFIYVIGPFASKLAAELMAIHGEGNPHMQHVSECNTLARKGREWLRKRGFGV